jgi:hypothetical protein
MATFDWLPFLQQWSHEWIETEEGQRKLPPEVLASGWLGYPGATEEQLAAAEARLGMTFPPSYRAFLKVTNGWRLTSPFIYKLWSTEEIEWFSVRNQFWIDAYTKPASGKSPMPLVSDEEYFFYGEDGAAGEDFKPEHLQGALEISDIGDSAIYLLNPQVVTPEGEWEAWFFANWNPGATRYRSFWNLMQAEYTSFLQLR